MMLTQQNEKKWNYLALAFAIPFVGMLLVMLVSRFEPFGQYSMLYSDMYHQYYPFFVEFRRALLSGDSLLFNWTIGMGVDYLGLFSYYLASPLNLLSILVPEDLMLEYFSLLVPIKLGLASLFFAIFLKKTFRRDDLSISLFGAFYGLCAWALGYQWNIMWLDTFALLPLVALGTVALLRDKKFILYTFTLFLSIYSNYYVGFFTCIFVFLLFFCYQICRFRGFKRFFLDLCRIALFSILAIGMTMFLELPTLAALQTTQSSVNNFPEGFDLNITGADNLLGLLDAMRQVASNTIGGIRPTFKEGLPNLYCGVGSMLLAFLFLTTKKVKLSDKICAVALLVFFMLSFIIRQLDYIWHGFHFPNMIPYRFSFLFSFVVLYMAYRAFLIHRSFKPWQFVVSGLLVALIFLCSTNIYTTIPINLRDILPFYKDLGLEDTLLFQLPYALLYNCLFLALYLGAFLAGCYRKPPHRNADEDERRSYLKAQLRQRNAVISVVACIMAAELALNLVNFGAYFTGTNISNYPTGTVNTESMVRYMQEREEDTLFYRAEVTHSQTLNDGSLIGYNGISTFTSSANVKVTEFMRALGYAAKNTYNRYCFEEGSPISNLFLNLKYMLERDGRVEENNYFTPVHDYGNVYLLENNAYLPLGFLANSELADISYNGTMNRFTFQNQLIQAAAGIVGNPWITVRSGNLQITADDTVRLESTSGVGYALYDTDGQTGSVTFTYTADRSGLLCLDLTLSCRNSYSVTKNGVTLYSESYSLPQMIAVSQVQPGDIIEVRFACKANEYGSLNCSACILNETLFRQAYDVLAASTLELTEFSNTYVEGTIDCNRDGLLYTSIPQNGNWSVTVDGEAVEPVLVGGAMIGVHLTEGQHTVAFTYRNSAFELGAGISLVCALIFGGLVWLRCRPAFKKGRYERIRRRLTD